jgi:predicted DNA-binding protein (UPF0251 family)/predicted Fe-Mo cluster-binding NifX family protein
MSRPHKCRRVAFLPDVTYFKPAGIPMRTLEEVRLSVEEAEAIRLKDLEGLEQEEGARRMNISRPTFQRVLASARQKIADALLKGKAIRIEGGSFEMASSQPDDIESEIKEVIPTRIAVSASGQSMDAEVDPRFGRCRRFIIADPETMEFEVVDNSSASESDGAGVSAAQKIVEKGVQVVLTGNCGPNAYKVLSPAGIQVVTGVSGKVRDAIESYRSGKPKMGRV